MKIIRTYLTSLLITLALVACGGGGSDSSSSSSTSTTPTSTFSLATPAGTACSSSFSNTDAFGNIQFQPSVGNTTWGCLVVDQANSQPIVSGTQSVRFEMRPGDCDSTQTYISGSDTAASDCTTDRGRYEIYQKSGSSTEGQIITYNYFIYIPGQSFQPQPKGGSSSTPLTVLTQINWQCKGTPCPSLGSNGYGSLFYLKIDYTGTLSLQTHQGFTWNANQVVTVDSNPWNKWIKLTYVIKSTAASNGYIQAYANDKLLINEIRATLPNANSTAALKVGIYDAYLSGSSQAWPTQVVYFDGFSTSVTNF